MTGYQLTNTVEATIRDVETVGALIDAALAAGATSMDGLAFRLADPDRGPGRGAPARRRRRPGAGDDPGRGSRA